MPEEKKPRICADCVKCITNMLDARMRRMIAAAREEDATGEDDSEENTDLAKAECFHLMEIRRIIEGGTTCGIYDDFGPPLTISGPLFTGGAER